ncbi:MAG: hypothetical protein MJ185_02670 [Treponema sp.]|nr:hypothetical protein [Treponema sp.]
MPQTNEISYTLFAKGFNIDIPKLSEDESELLFRFYGETTVLLFYNFGKFKKAYAVTGWQNERDGEPVFLPGVDEKLCVLFSVRGKRALILEKIIKYLTSNYNNEVFQLPLTFWYKMGVLIDSHRTRKVYIENILQLSKNNGKEFFYSKQELEEEKKNAEKSA